MSAGSKLLCYLRTSITEDDASPNADDKDGDIQPGWSREDMEDMVHTLDCFGHMAALMCDRAKARLKIYDKRTPYWRNIPYGLWYGISLAVLTVATVFAAFGMPLPIGLMLVVALRVIHWLLKELRDTESSNMIELSVIDEGCERWRKELSECTYDLYDTFDEATKNPTIDTKQNLLRTVRRAYRLLHAVDIIDHPTAMVLDRLARPGRYPARETVEEESD